MLSNPIFLRAGVVLFFSTFAFVMGLLFMRLLKKSIAEESDFSANPTRSFETLPLHLYNTVIQQLKQQKHELQVQSKAEQHRARISENFSQAVLSNLSCGVLVFGPNGLGEDFQRVGEGDSWLCFDDGNGCGRYFPRRDHQPLQGGRKPRGSGGRQRGISRRTRLRCG